GPEKKMQRELHFHGGLYTSSLSAVEWIGLEADLLPQHFVREESEIILSISSSFSVPDATGRRGSAGRSEGESHYLVSPPEVLSG
ncbi:MAG: hypothetical protein WCK05_06240, partial [Planctomycetota bacterium]